MRFTGIVPKGGSGPLDRVVRALYGASWGRARALIGTGKVRVDGALTREATTRVATGAEIAIDLQAARTHLPELTDREVVHCDAQVVVVAKPAGVSTIPYDDSEADTLDARVRGWLARRRMALPGRRPNLGVVHRLDKETTGLVVFTRTWLAKKALAAQFRRHSVHRRYLAIVAGSLNAPCTLRSWFVGDRGDGLRGSARAGKGAKGGQEAISHVEPVEALAGATLIACRLETGRTHQIRIHLSEAGHPLVGEHVYVRRFRGERLPAPRLMLHAAELGFVHPATEREVRWLQAIPEDMSEVLDRLRRGR
jgi:23S rRNA pseudouridine1911/1915/1917 synthase